MEPHELQMHGSMFLLLKKFIEHAYGPVAWELAKRNRESNSSDYSFHENYPAEEMFAIIQTAAKNTGITENELKEKFGIHLVPDLLATYKSHLKPEWKTFELLQYTELVMHKAVRTEESQANPPVLNISRVHDKLLIIDYYSRRKMAALAVGIIKGIAKYYNETDIIKVIPTTDLDDERVQIRCEFNGSEPENPDN